MFDNGHNKVEAQSSPRPALPPARTPSVPPQTRLQARPGETYESPQVPITPFTERVPENVAAMLAYLFGWVGGLVLLFVDRRPFVRYHAAQSVVIFATLSGILLVLGDFFLGTFLPGAEGFWLALRRIVELVWLAAAIVLMLKAAAGERFRVKGAAAVADRAAHADA